MSYLGMCLETLRKTTKNSANIAYLRSELCLCVYILTNIKVLNSLKSSIELLYPPYAYKDYTAQHFTLNYIHVSLSLVIKF